MTKHTYERIAKFARDDGRHLPAQQDRHRSGGARAPGPAGWGRADGGAGPGAEQAVA
jgi:hypothetical protein